MTNRQKQIMVDFLSCNRHLVNGQLKGPHGKLLYKQKWTELAKLLNAEEGGAKKTVAKWQRAWTHTKTFVKSKLSKIKKHSRRTGGGAPCPVHLTPIEEQISMFFTDKVLVGLSDVPESGVTEPKNLCASINNTKTEITEEVFIDTEFDIPYHQTSTPSSALSTSSSPVSTPTVSPASSTSSGNFREPAKRRKVNSKNVDSKFVRLLDQQNKLLTRIADAVEKFIEIYAYNNS